jgi:serine protease Do
MAKPIDLSKVSVTGAGSGFFVSPAGTILTNKHVVDACERIVVLSSGNEPAWGRPLARDGAADLALIETLLRPAAVARLGGTPDARLGEEVVVAGFRGSKQERSPYVGEGRITWVPGPKDKLVMLAFAGHAEPGMSGGPLLDARSQLAGVVFAAVANEHPGKDAEFGYAIQMGVVRGFLAKHGVHPGGAVAAQEGNREVAKAAARQMTVRLLCVGAS